MILDTDKLVNDAAYLADARHRFLTDHFYAAEVLGFSDFTERAHRPAVNLYFGKNPRLPMKEQHSKHRRLHLDPRKTFKTTLKRVDRIQWIAAFPETVTILVESATQPLAKEIVEASARTFHRRPGAGSKQIHLLFPELVTERWPDGKWNTPNRRYDGPGDLDSSLDFTSPRTTQSGWHPFIMEPDDVEDTLNSGIGVSAEVRQHVIDVCDQNENLLREGGFINICGTRYHPFDYYGKCLERAARNPDGWEILVRATVRMRNGGRLVPGEFPREEDIEILFPDFMALSYSECRDMFETNYESFMCQQQNDPQGGHVTRFDEKLYASCQIEESRIPRGGETFICWRPRYGGKESMAKYSEGAAARIIDGRIIVLDAWQGQYTASGEAEKIVHQMREHDAQALMLIDVPGSEYVTAHVRNESLKKNRSIRIHWLEFEEDDHRRDAQIEQLEPMMKVGRILFSTAMGKAHECRKQFVHFGLVQENGIAECVARFADKVPISLMRASMEDNEVEWQRRRRDEAMLSQFIEQQGMEPLDETVRQQTDAHLKAMQAATTHGFPPLPGGLDG